MAQLILNNCEYDATIDLDNPTTVHHQAVEHTRYSPDWQYRIVMKFNLNSLPTNAQVKSVRLDLFGAAYSKICPVSIYRIVREWDESTVTWNSPWATAGCNNTTTDRSGVAMASATGITQGWNTFNISVVEFELMRASNKGMLLVQTGEVDFQDQLNINGRSAASNTPRLSIMYTEDSTIAPVPYSDEDFRYGMRYQVEHLDHYGVRKNVIQAFNSLEYVKTANAIGSLVINLPRGLMQYDDFSVGDILEVWREKGGVLEMQNETAYFLQNWEFWTDGDGAEYVRLTASDANWLLDTAIVWAYAASAAASKTDYADDMMKAVVEEQLGVTAGTTRTKLTCAPDLSAAGAAITKEFAYRNVLTVIQELAEVSYEAGEWLGFDVVRTAPATFEFRTYTDQRGKNHGRLSGDPRLVGKQYGNFSQATFGEFHADERNAILVGGQGEDDKREWVTRTNDTRIKASKWNRREYMKDSRDNATTETLESDGDAALDEFKPKRIMTGTLHDTPGMQYNVHYGFGDVLSVEAFGYFVDCHVKSVRVKVDQDNGEQIDIKLEGEL